jgi:hypothetical protein
MTPMQAIAGVLMVAIIFDIIFGFGGINKRTMMIKWR